MEQEIGHGEACSSVTNLMGFSSTRRRRFPYSDPNVFQTCNGPEGASTSGEGPCNLTTFLCSNATTQGTSGPTACPTNNATNGALCEFSDGFCCPRGNSPVTINGSRRPRIRRWPSAPRSFQNGDLDFDGTRYQADWPNGSSNYPTSVSYIGPFTRGHTYPGVQFETDIGGPRSLCNTTTGVGCATPPTGAAFYPFWSIDKTQTLGSLSSHSGVCVWNFGNDNPGVTTKDFGGSAQYGSPDLARYGGTLISSVIANPEFAKGCKSISF